MKQTYAEKITSETYGTYADMDQDIFKTILEQINLDQWLGIA